MKRIVTGDNILICGFNAETKMQYSQWFRKNLLRTMQTQQTEHNNFSLQLQSSWQFIFTMMLCIIKSYQRNKLYIADIISDRGPFICHGRIKALAEAPRGGGLNFWFSLRLFKVLKHLKEKLLSCREAIAISPIITNMPAQHITTESWLLG